MHHRRAEVLEIGDVPASLLPHCASEVYSAPFHHYIYIITLATEEAISNITSYHKGSYASAFSNFSDYPEYRPVQKLSCYR